MSLKDKLSGLSQNLEKEKKTKEKSEEDKRLEPTRANIKSLDSARRDLDLIKGSLDFKVLNKSEENDKKIKPKSGEIDVLTLKNKEAFGMQDYSEQTDKKIKTRSGELDTLVSENKEALKELGVEDKEQLAVHPEFAEEEEVVNYKKSLAQGEELKMSDAKLKERLTKLGVEFDEKNFSYETASQAVEKKIKNIDAELAQEKPKTPEGREEIINNLAEEFEKSTGRLELSSISVGNKLTESVGDKLADRTYDKNQSDFSYDFGTDRNNFRINFKDEKASVDNWSNLKLIPDNFKDIETAYGEEIAREALEKAYQNKIHNNFVQWDERGDKAVSLKEQIKAVSPEENNAAREKMDEAIKKLNGILPLLQKKSDELKEKGVEFDPAYFPGYGTYNEIICLNDSTSSAKYINENINNNFPPRYDAIKLQEASDKLIDWVDKFAEVINNLRTQEDVNNFLLYEKGWGTAFKKGEKEESTVEAFHGHFLSSRLKTQEYEFRLEGNNTGAVSRLTERCKTYSEAEKYLNGIIEKNSEGENRVSEAIINTVKTHLKRSELETEIKQEKIGDGTHDLKHRIEEIAREKETATKVMGEIESLQSELSSDPKIAKENLILEDRIVVVPSLKQEYEDLTKNQPLKEGEWRKKQSERAKHESAQPKLFGKEKWQTRLDELKKEENAAENEYTALMNQNSSALYYKAYRAINIDNFSVAGKLVHEHKAQGKASEIFNGLKAELMKVIDTTLPPKVLQDYAEYKTLVEKIG